MLDLEKLTLVQSGTEVVGSQHQPMRGMAHFCSPLLLGYNPCRVHNIKFWVFMSFSLFSESELQVLVFTPQKNTGNSSQLLNLPSVVCDSENASGKKAMPKAWIVSCFQLWNLSSLNPSSLKS